MPRSLGLRSLVPALLAVLATLTLAGCNVLFVPRRQSASPSPTPNTAVHLFPALEARLPDSIDGHALQKFSLTTDPQAQSPKTLEVLTRLNKTLADLQLARGYATGADLTVSAMRIVGADASQAAADFELVDEGDPTSTSTYTPAVVVGKRVLIRVTGSTTEYMYPLGDIIFVVQSDRALAEAALTAIQ